MIATKRGADLGSPVLEQFALADLLQSGAYDSHLRRARRAYLAKRDELLSCLEHHAPELSVTGLAAGLHTVLELPRGVTETKIVRAARKRSVGVYPLTRYRLASSGPPSAITLGYGGLTRHAIREGVTQLAAALDDM